MSACLYCYPLDGDGVAGSLERIEIPAGKGITVLETFQARARMDAQASEGPPSFAHYGAGEQVTIKIAGLVDVTHDAFIARLAALDSALQLGSVCGFSRDRTKAGAWPVTVADATAFAVPTQGDLVMERYATDILNLESSPALVAGDIVVVETAPPESHQHMGVLSDWGTGSYPDMTLAAGSGVFFKSAASNAWIRWRDFYPYLFLSQDSLREPRLRRVGGVQWEWGATLISAPNKVVDNFPELGA